LSIARPQVDAVIAFPTFGTVAKLDVVQLCRELEEVVPQANEVAAVRYGLRVERQRRSIVVKADLAAQRGVSTTATLATH